jgi:ring-1,2-phenylacetyl-CoA epoxidase subunit PaaE
MVTKSNFYKLRVKEIAQETEDCISISFDLPEDNKEDFSYLSGQYLTFKAQIENEEVRRSYSLCSEPSSGTFKVGIKRIEKGLFSNYAHDNIKVGSVLETMKPSGNFQHIPEPSAEKNYVLFAAGSGITPILSILKSILLHELNSTVMLVYGNKAVQSIIFKEEIEALKNTYLNRLSVIHILSRENLGNTMQKGRIDKEKCELIYETYFAELSIDDVFICGPEQMTLDIRETLIRKGLNKSAIHLELFGTGYDKKAVINQKSSKKTDDSTIILQMDGDEFEFTLNNQGVSILDGAQQSGLDVPYACKGGVCCTCKGKVLEGTVSMDVNYALEQDEVNQGYILTCQAHPTSKKVIVTFDE